MKGFSQHIDPRRQIAQLFEDGGQKVGRHDIARGNADLPFDRLGLACCRQRDAACGWMMRGYAIAVGTGAQALIYIPWVLIVGMPGELSRALLMGAGWAISLAVAEWIIRRRPASFNRSGH